MLSQGGVLLKELDHTVGQLRMIEREAAHLVQWDEHPDQELLVFCLEGKGKAIDNASQNLKQLSNPVEVLRLVNKP